MASRFHEPSSLNTPGRRPRAGDRMLMAVVALSLALSGFSGIVSELSLFNLTESLVGGTNTSLTYTIGFMMFAMGVGSALTAHRLFQRIAPDLLIAVEVALSLLTMTSVVGIFLLSGWFPGSALWWILLTSPLIGLLIGMEIPIVLRLNEMLGLRLRLNAPLVLAPDYMGALAAFVLFTFVLLPALGLGRVAWLGGVLNLAVAFVLALAFHPYLRRPGMVYAGFALCAAIAVGLGIRMPEMMAFAEQRHFRDEIIWSRETPYQRLVITDGARAGNPRYEERVAPRYQVTAESGPLSLRRVRGIRARVCSEDVRLFINGALQFSTCDEHRYHEMLVHPAAALAARRTRALVLGGGDGLAVRELLKYAGMRVWLIELDTEVITAFRDDPRFARLNGGSLSDPRVRVILGDGFRWLRETRERYDLIVMDFPDPYTTATARLYSVQLFRHARRRLAPGGVLVTQSFSPLYQPTAFQVVGKSMRAAGFNTVPLQVPMLTFEQWGFHLGSVDASVEDMRRRLDQIDITVPARYLNREAVQAAHRWGKDLWLPDSEIPVNDQFSLPLLRLYRQIGPTPE